MKIGIFLGPVALAFVALPAVSIAQTTYVPVPSVYELIGTPAAFSTNPLPPNPALLVSLNPQPLPPFPAPGTSLIWRAQTPTVHTYPPESGR